MEGCHRSVNGIREAFEDELRRRDPAYSHYRRSSVLIGNWTGLRRIGQAQDSWTELDRETARVVFGIFSRELESVLGSGSGGVAMEITASVRRRFGEAYREQVEDNNSCNNPLFSVGSCSEVA